jgi:hypothetical protein
MPVKSELLAFLGVSIGIFGVFTLYFTLLSLHAESRDWFDAHCSTRQQKPFLLKHFLKFGISVDTTP